MKKKAFIIALFLFAIISNAQSTGFSAVGGKLLWENVFITSETNIPAIIQRHSRLKIISEKGPLYKGTATGVGSSCPETSKILKSEYNFDFEIEVAEGKYRVTVSNIRFTGKGKASTEAGKYYITNNELTATNIAEKDLACIDAYLNKIFTMTFIYKSRS